MEKEGRIFSQREYTALSEVSQCERRAWAAHTDEGKKAGSRTEWTQEVRSPTYMLISKGIETLG